MNEKKSDTFQIKGEVMFIRCPKCSDSAIFHEKRIFDDMVAKGYKEEDFYCDKCDVQHKVKWFKTKEEARMMMSLAGISLGDEEQESINKALEQLK